MNSGLPRLSKESSSACHCRYNPDRMGYSVRCSVLSVIVLFSCGLYFFTQWEELFFERLFCIVYSFGREDFHGNGEQPRVARFEKKALEAEIIKSMSALSAERDPQSHIWTLRPAVPQGVEDDVCWVQAHYWQGGFDVERKVKHGLL